jgi:hypothetical protein
MKHEHYSQHGYINFNSEAMTFEKKRVGAFDSSAALFFSVSQPDEPPSGHITQPLGDVEVRGIPLQPYRNDEFDVLASSIPALSLCSINVVASQPWRPFQPIAVAVQA